MHCTCSQREWKLCLFNCWCNIWFSDENWSRTSLDWTQLFIRVIKLYIDRGNVVINYQCFKIPIYLFISLSWTSGLSVSVIGGSLLAWYSTHLVAYYCGFKMGHSRRKHKNLVWDSQSIYYFWILILAIFFFRIIINFIHANFVEHV